MIKVTPFIYEDLDDLYANTYVVSDDNNNCIVIDPTKNNQGIINFINKHQLTLKAVLITHGHIDHIRGIDIIIDYFHVPLYIGFYDADKLDNPKLNCSSLLNQPFIVKSKPQTLAENDTLDFLNEQISVMETPYHTSGSLCYYFKQSAIVFSGDFIFDFNLGRADLPSAQPGKLQSSLQKLFSLPLETKIYGGHGKMTTIKQEKLLNKIVK